MHADGRRNAVLAALAVAGVVAVVLLAAWGALIGPEAIVEGGRGMPSAETRTPTPTETPVGVPRDEVPLEERGDGWLGVVIATLALALTVLVGLALVALAVLAAVALWRWWRERARPEEGPEVGEIALLGEPPRERVEEEMRRDADAQLRALQEGSPRNGIVACWLRFEAQGEAAGVARHPWETSSEYAIRVLDVVAAEPGAVTRLADLYREARFSDHELTEAHRAEAAAALESIHAATGGVR